MKSGLFLLFLSGLFITQTYARDEKELVFVVTNPAKTVRQNETIELNWQDLVKRLPTCNPDRLTVVDLNTGKKVITQIWDCDQNGQPESLLFQTDFTRDDPVKTYRLAMSDAPAERISSLLYGRFVPERKDDFAWENDCIAFRMYGKSLETELISSGIDVWVKRAPYPIIDRWYAAGDAAYHVDSGEGLDFYSVGPTRGCGGTGIWNGQTLVVSKNFRSARVLANGPIRFQFELIFDDYTLNGIPVSESKRISLDAGQNFNRIECIYRTPEQQQIQFAAGLAVHKDAAGSAVSDQKQGWFSQWENYTDHGGLGSAMILDPNALLEFREQDSDHLAICAAQTGQTICYYAGAGWNKSGQFSNQDKWHDHVRRYAENLQTPLTVAWVTSGREQHIKPDSWARLTAQSIMKMYPNPADMDIYGKGWTYTNGFFLHGLYRLWEKEKNPQYLAFIKKWLDSYIGQDGKLSAQEYKPEEYKLDDVESGKVALLMYQNTHDKRYLTACEQLLDQLQKQPKTSDGGYWHKLVYPWQMWLDGIYMADAFAMQYAAATQQKQYFDEAIKQIMLIARHTIDEQTGLYYHGWDENKNPVWADPLTGVSPCFWGRAVGWFAMALVDGLDALPANHPDRDKLLAILQKLSASLIKFQDPETGLWYQVLDRGQEPDNWHETSCSAMFCYALARSANQGYLPPRYKKYAQKAFKGLCDHHIYFDDQGLLYLTGTVKVGTLNFASSKGDYAYYVNTDRRINDFKGIGAFLFAALELER